MLNGDIDTVELEGQIVSTVSLEGDLLPIGPKGDKGDDGFSPVVTTSKSGKTTTIKFETATGNVYAYVQDGEDGQGSGDMLTDVYDQNKNGIVDNAEACNGHTLAKDVPADAVFTDTTYESKEAASGGSDVSLCTTGEKYTWNNKSDFSGSYNDLSNKPTIPTKTSDLTNDSGFINNTVNNLTNYTPTSSLSTVALTGSYSDLSNKPSIPSKTSDLTNDSGFIDKTVNDLTNYYKKSDTYTKTEANTLLGAKANSSDLATVATSGSYNDLSNKPTIPDELADLSDDSTHRLVSDTEKTTWNNKVDSTGDATTTGENTSFSLTNVLEAPLLMDLKGNTSQNTLSGKNLFDTNNLTLNTLSGLTSSIKDATLKLNGTNSTQGYIITTSSTGVVLPAGTYTLSMVVKGTCNILDTNYNTVLYLLNGNTNTSFHNMSFRTTYYNSSKTQSSQFTLTDSTPISVQMFTNGSVAYNNIEIMMQIESGSSFTGFEPYCGGIPSPNPSYPQNVNVVSGDNEIVVCGKNFFNSSLEIGAFDTNGLPESINTRIRSKDFTFVKPNTTYTISWETTKNARLVVIEYSTNTSSSQQITRSPSQYASSPYTFTTTSTTNYIKLYIISTGDTSTSVSDISNIMLNTGETASTYEAYNGNTYPINLPVENLFDNSSTVWIRNNNSNYTDNDNLNTTRIRIQNPIKLEEGKTYTISGIPNGISLGVVKFYTNNSTTDNTYVNTKTFTIPTGRPNVIFQFNGENFTDSTNTLMQNANIQLEEGTYVNTYTPYGTTPIELCKIGDYQDYIYKEDDKWYLHKGTGKYVLTGTGATFQFANGIYYTNTQIFTKGNGDILSNYFTYGGTCTNTSTAYANGDGKISYNPSYGVYFRNDNLTSKSQWDTWLTTNNPLLYYPLETATNTEITYTPLIEQLNAIEDAESYEGSTNVNQVNNDLPFILDITAFLDTYDGRYEALDKRVSDNSSSIQVLNNEVDSLINYSTTEQVIGKWIDGKPLYRKVIDCGYLPNATSKNVAIGYNMNQINIVRLYGTARENTGYTIPIPHVNNNNVSQQVQCEVSTNGIYLRTGVNYSVLYCYIILEYTKTTD